MRTGGGLLAGVVLVLVAHGCAPSLRESRLLAEQGDADAQFNLGLMYHMGQGVPRDYAEAVKWYRRTAVQGDAIAQHATGSTTRSFAGGAGSRVP